MSNVLFITSLAGLALLIFVLSLILSGINHDQPHDTGDAADKRHPSDNEEGHTSSKALVATITDAIHTYRRDRQSDDRHRAKREKVTIVVLGLTAIFALAAAGAAIYSSLIFSNQLGEMHQASIDTGELVKTSRETEERQLRAYVGIAADNVSLTCHSCDYTTVGPFSISPKYMEDDSVDFNLENGGQTPAYNVFVEDSYYLD